MTWAETYWNDATADPAYFAAVSFDTVLDGDYGSRLFGAWIEDNHPHGQSLALIRALEYLLVTNAFADDATDTMQLLADRMARPWDDEAMEAALAATAARFGDLHVPLRIDDDSDVEALFEVLTSGDEVFSWWREQLREAAVGVLRDGGTLGAFLDDCVALAHHAKSDPTGQPSGKGKEKYDDSDSDSDYSDGYLDDDRYAVLLADDDADLDPGFARTPPASEDSSDDEGMVTVVRKRGTTFSEPEEVAEKRYPWLHHTFRLAVAFTLNPEANSRLGQTFTWDEAQEHLRQWGVDIDELVDRIGQATQNPYVKMYRDERLMISVNGTTVEVTATIDSALNAHNSGIIATLDSEGAFTHYVQFKDLVMFYTDENDMNTPIYNVLKTFGDPWAGGNAESYVVRHGKGRKAYFTVTPVRASHQGSVVAVVKRCSGGMDVKILN
ncbi:hypothetical protein [Micromonospora cathayae]|uniref:Uncharacterized protein n=1 Tax=Micromonospora cathayae TaxID=3028804 RepID=A0ABY7ZVJ8_9ACTN|nr:hypothetical protein [Micromonospora sp. HUAS 3]WDZ87010.1 hypothetical protein PVK37_11715 [Micromonospora sp. HUAS 3]